MNLMAVNSNLSPAQSWQVVLQRDPNYDGRLYYGVRSTGVYCRPSCPSRRPRQEQVRFFDQPQSAERAGFRPCRRCKPTDINPTAHDVELVRTVCKHISENLEGTLNLATLSAQLNVSPYQ